MTVLDHEVHRAEIEDFLRRFEKFDDPDFRSRAKELDVKYYCYSIGCVVKILLKEIKELGDKTTK